jgi:ketosteroid isomerase-like protein
VQIRAATADDAEAIASVLSRSFAEFKSAYTPEGFAATTPTTDKLRARRSEGTGFQIATVQIGDMPRPTDMKIRVTEIFRKIDGAWKLVHRHADMGRTPE